MIVKVLLVACVAAAQAGVLAPYAYGGYNPYSSYPAQPAIASHQTNTYRSPFNLGQISTYTKALDTPFSSVRKSDVRVSNPGVAVSAYGGYAAPYAAPYTASVAAPLVSHVGVTPYAKVATAGGLLGVAYSAAPAVSHMSYTNSLGLAYAW